MQNNNDKLRTLPPGVDQIDDDVIFGNMWIQIGTLKLVRTSNAYYHVLCQFWGQPTPSVLQTRADLPNNDANRIQKYQIKCPAPYFKEYLQEMSQKFKLQVQGVGKVDFNIQKFLKKQVKIQSQHAFDHFKGFFEIMGKGGRKAGSLQIQMGSQFYPQIALRELGEANQSKSFCPLDTQKIKDCEGDCACHEQSPNKYQQLQDRRIPHSLDCKSPQQKQFNADKYKKQQQECELKQTSKQFPQIPKVLTYSNLRMNYKGEQEQDNSKSQFKEQDKQQLALRNNKQQIRKLIQIQHQQQPSKPPVPITQQPKESVLKKEMAISDSIQSEVRINVKPSIKKQQLFDEFYGIEDTPNKIIEEPQYNNNNNNLSPINRQANKLSRVVNLTEELHKYQPQSNYNPHKLIETDFNVHKFAPFNTHQSKGKSMGKKTTKSNLLLNLLIEVRTQSIKMKDKNKNKILVVHKPYGQNERVTLGPQFSEVITILCPVGEHQLNKMDKVPFILQFWDSYDHKLFGIIKINLHKIKKGFIINNKLNQVAIKTNLFPTIIQKGLVTITDISSKGVGQCQLNASIGTSAQLDSYLNQTKNRFAQNTTNNNHEQQRERERDRQKQKEKQQQNTKQKQNKQVMSLTKITNNFLHKLDINGSNQNIIKQLMEMIKQKYINRQEFNQLLHILQLDNIKDNNEDQVLWTIYSQICSNKEGKVSMDDISNTYNHYQHINQIIYAYYIGKSKCLRKQLQQNKVQIQKDINRQSCFGIIEKNKLNYILLNYSINKNIKLIDEYLLMFKDNINVNIVSNTLSHKPNHMMLLPYLNPQYYSHQVIHKLTHNTHSVLQHILQQYNNVSNIDIYTLYYIMNKYNIPTNIWEIIHLFNIINRDMDSGNQGQVRLQDMMNWFTIWNNKQMVTKKQQEQRRQREKQKEQEQKEQPNNIGKENIKSLSNSQVSSDKQQKQKEQPKKQKEIEKQAQSHHDHIDDSNDKAKQQPPVYRHLFTFDGIQISLQNPIKGTCSVYYIFPYQQDKVRSKNIQIINDKHKYGLKLYGTHGFTISDSLSNYLGDNVIKFFIIINEKIEYEGGLHTDELSIQENTQQTKVIPIFSDKEECMGGKIKLHINYQRKLSSQCNIGKETTYQLYLPKSGYINYNIATNVDINKLRSQLNISEQFYVSLALDVFAQAPNLKTHFPPISSKLFSDFSSPLQLQGSLRINLSSLILNYIRTQSALLKLNIIYYSKERGNFQRKETAYGTIQFPLINLIKNAGIQGDYAFKNKYGMFVTLASCQLKYQKQPYSPTEVALSGRKNQNSKQNIWIILHFLELINLQNTKISWVKFEFVLKGKKYSTQKQYIRSQRYNYYNYLKNANIVLQLTEQDFYDTKILAITMLTNLSQRMAIDINLKSVGKKLSKEKYTVNNQYFVVVDHDSHTKKMRVGMKLYSMRGSAMIGNFVDILSRHLDIEVLDELQLPKQLSNYEKILGLWKAKLKISNRLLQDVMGELLRNRKKDKLNINMFTCQIQFRLDMTPIMIDSSIQPQSICQQLQTQIKQHQLLSYLQENSIKLHNFRQQFLSRYSFKQLNKDKIDKNIQFLGLHDEVDLILFTKKLKSQEEAHHNNQNEETYERQDKQVMMEINQIKGHDLNLLYNGIKPNAVIKLPNLQFETQIISRNANPSFVKKCVQYFNNINTQILKKMIVQVYHAPSEQNQEQDMLIGEGMLNLLQLQNSQVPFHKVYRVKINSTMSGRMQAQLQLKVSLNEQTQQQQPNTQDHFNVVGEQSYGQNSSFYDRQGSKIGQMLSQLNREMGRKKALFLESSDEEY